MRIWISITSRSLKIRTSHHILYWGNFLLYFHVQKGFKKRNSSFINQQYTELDYKFPSKREMFNLCKQSLSSTRRWKRGSRKGKAGNPRLGKFGKKSVEKIRLIYWHKKLGYKYIIQPLHFVFIEETWHVVCLFVSMASFCLTNVSIFALFPIAVNLLCKLPWEAWFRDLDPFYRIIEIWKRFDLLTPYNWVVWRLGCEDISLMYYSI